MAFNRPSLPDLIARVKTDLTALPGSSPRLRYTVEGILGTTLAGLAHGLYGYIDKAVAQMFPDTADSRYMRRWAAFYGVDPIAATAAHSDAVAITGTGTSLCPAGTLWQRADGVVYSQDDAVNLVAGEGSIAVTATTTGLNTNADVGTVLAIVSPVAGIDSEATVTDAAVGGVDDEGDDALLARLLQRLRYPPQGGGPGNYITWALEVPGVTRAWEFPLLGGPGTVGVAFVRDGDGAGMDIIPSEAEIEEVADYIALRAPVSAVVSVFAPDTFVVDFSIAPTPNTSDIRDAIEAELKDYLFREGEPGATLPLSQLNEAISQAPGLLSHVMSVPASEIVLDQTQIPIYGTTTWL